MLIYILLGMTAIFLVGGIFLFVKGYGPGAEEKNAVLISDFKEIKDLHKDVAPQTPVVSEPIETPSQPIKENAPPSLAEHLLKENLDKKNTNVKERESPLENTDTAKEKEISSVDQKEIEEIQKLNDQKLRESADIINTMLGQKKEWERTRSDLDLKVEQVKKQLANLKDTNDEKMKESQCIINTMLDEKMEWKQIRSDLDLKVEQTQRQVNDLKNTNDQKMKEASSIINAMLDQKKEWAQMRNDLDLKVEQTQEQLVNLRNTNDQKMKESEEVIQSLLDLKKKLIQNEVKVLAEKADVEKKFETLLKEVHAVPFEESKMTIVTLQKEKKDLRQTKDSLELEFQKIKRFNDYLLEKEKKLQYELTKTRAQALGLEKSWNGLGVKGK